jgi:hypothetical protein
MLRAFALLLVVLLVVLLAIYWRDDRGRPWTAYAARPAWLRAGIYFCACYLISYASGGMELILTSPVVTAEQWQDPAWIAWTVGAFAFIAVAYGFVWVRYTVVFDRERTPWVSASFGFLWGSSSGQLFLAVYLFVGRTELPTWGVWLVTYLVCAAWQPNWHSIYWDHYIAPEHDTRLTQRIKALGCHIPNLAICLTYLTLYDNYALFVLLEILACVPPAIGMRFPAPWAGSSPLDLARRSGGRIPRCVGYESTDFRTDPRTSFYPGWHAVPEAEQGRPVQGARGVIRSR